MDGRGPSSFFHKLKRTTMARPGKQHNWRKLTGAARSRLVNLWSQRLFPGGSVTEPAHDRSFWICLLALALLAGVILLPNRSYPLFEPDEGRRAEISREILCNHDWVICTLNHQPYYDKPPLFHWLVAVSFFCFGTSAAVARLVPALSALLTILAAFVLGRRLVGHRPAFLGALTLTLTGAYGFYGRLVGLDGTLTLFVTVSMLAAHEAVHKGRLCWRWWLLSAACCGLGVLTKGPVAVVLLGMPLVLHVSLSAGAHRPTLVQAAVFFVVVAAVNAPWVILVLLRDSALLYEFLVEHNFRRFTAGIAHEEAWWYYLPMLTIACLPWSPLFPFFLRHLTNDTAEARAQRFRPLGYLLLWGCWCVLFFSLSRGKLPLYIVPALPAFALLTGWFLDQVLWPASSATTLRFVRAGLASITFVMIGAGWAVLCYLAWRRGLVSSTSLVVTGLCAAELIASFLVLARRLSPLVKWGACCLIMLGVEVDLAHRLVPALARHKSPLAASSELCHATSGRPVAVAVPGQEWASLAFACRGDIFDIDHSSMTELIAFLRRHPRVFIVADTGKIKTLRNEAPADCNLTVVGSIHNGLVVLAQQQKNALASRCKARRD
jgi:dolichol-phosphate mannosyltransferase